MSRTVPPIKEFPKDGRVWRVDWFGAVERNYDIPSEPYLQVVISPLRQGAADYASNSSVAHDDRRTILIGVGQLPLLSIGSHCGWKATACLIGLGRRRRLKVSTSLTRRPVLSGPTWSKMASSSYRSVLIASAARVRKAGASRSLGRAIPTACSSRWPRSCVSTTPPPLILRTHYLPAHFGTTSIR